MKLGKFIKDCSGDIHGRIFGLGLGVTPVMFEPQTSKEGKPYFRIIASPIGEAYDIGAAFERQKDGSNYFTVSLESPAFAAPVNAVLFPDREHPGLFNLFWERPEQFRPKLGLMTDGAQPTRKYIGAAATP